MGRGPGKWQRIIKRRLEVEAGFLLANCLEESLDREPTRAEYSAMYRAATLLAKAGGCTVERVWGTGIAAQRAALVWVCRSGVKVEGVARTAYEERLGMRPPPFPR